MQRADSSQNQVPTILDLIANGTMSAEMAATLWVTVDEGRSFVVVAIPRLAGKSTVGNAMLSLLPPEVPVHRLSGEEVEMDRLKDEATGGYLVVGEFSQAPVPGYIWGSPVRRVFDTLTAGYSLATALHAPGFLETFEAICQGNGVTDERASSIGLMVYLRRFGEDPNFWRRAAEIHEVDGVEGGIPRGRLLHRWVEDDDRFESVERPSTIRTDDVEARSARLSERVETGHTTADDVAQMVAEHRGS